MAVKAEEKGKRREKWKQRQISDEPEAALDLLDDLDDNPEKSEEMQEVWRSSNQTFIFHPKRIMKWMLQMTKKMKQ